MLMVRLFDWNRQMFFYPFRWVHYIKGLFSENNGDWKQLHTNNNVIIARDFYDVSLLHEK